MRLLKHLSRSRAGRIALLSYIAFGSSALCAIISIPLAVTFLGKEQIALWTLVSQIISYLVWMDLGVGDAIGRKIAEPVASGDRDEVNAWWTLSIGILAIQGLLLLIVGLLVWPLWGHWFSISSTLSPDALWLFSAALISAALAMPLRAYPGLLLAQQRFAWVPGSQCLAPWMQLAVFAACLHSGWGAKSYFFGVFAGHLVGWTIMFFAVHCGPIRVRLVRGAFSRQRAKSLFSYSGSIALVGFTQTLSQSLPSVMLGRLAGLPSVPVYGFTARIPELLGNLNQRTSHAFYPNLQNLIVTSQHELFRHKYREVQGLTIALGLMAAALILLGNRTIVSWLATPSFFGGTHVSLWFAVMAVTLPYARSFNHLLQYSGNMGKAPLVSLLCVAMTAASGWLAFRHYGMAGLAAAFAILPPLGFSLYSATRGSRNCGFGTWNLCGRGFMELVAVLTLVTSAGIWCIGGPETSGEMMIFGRMTSVPGLREWLTTCTLIPLGMAFVWMHLRKIRQPI